MATADRVQQPGFWPTKGSPSREEYVGPAACVRCHAAHAGQAATSMARTLARAPDSEVLRAHERLAFQVGRFAYEIARGEGGSVYSVADGTRALRSPLAWAFGAGKIGQTYMFERAGALFEGRVSYYESIRGLGFTPTRALAEPRDLEEAMGRPVGAAEGRRCFGCHTAASTIGGALDLARLIPGVSCESCHGPGARHVAAIEQGRLAEGLRATTNPKTLDPTASVDFCGACHATWWDVTLAGEKGIAALRSQPHRLQSSRCWGEGDARLTCVACHDPHEPLVREPLSYDERCLACHAGRGGRATRDRPGRACPVGTTGCTTCHMPKYEVPEMHHRFTDHLIRVLKPGGTTTAPRPP